MKLPLAGSAGTMPLASWSTAISSASRRQKEELEKMTSRSREPRRRGNGLNGQMPFAYGSDR